MAPLRIGLRLRLDLCDSPTATDTRRRLPLRRTRSRLWLALCEPPTASAFAIRRCRSEAPRWPPSASAFACGSTSPTPPPQPTHAGGYRDGAQDLACGSPCANPPPHQPSLAARPLRLPHRDRHTPAVTATAHKISPMARLVRTPHRISLRHSAATPPQGGSDTRVMKRERSLYVRPGTWFTSCPGIGQEALCGPQVSLPP